MGVTVPIFLSFETALQTVPGGVWLHSPWALGFFTITVSPSLAFASILCFASWSNMAVGAPAISYAGYRMKESSKEEELFHSAVPPLESSSPLTLSDEDTK